MRRPTAIVLLTFLLTGNVVGNAASNAETDPEPVTEGTEAVDVILEHPLQEEDYREERNCLWRRQVKDVEIIDENLLVFHGRIRGKIWLNKLSRECRGLHRNMIVSTTSQGGSICRMSLVGARPRGASPFEQPVRCWLGTFEAIDMAQLEALKRAVVERSKAAEIPEPDSKGP